jgi:hypothetical protein
MVLMNMRSFTINSLALIALVIGLGSSHALAQTNTTDTNSIAASPFGISGFIGPDYRFTSINHEWSHQLGVKTGLVLNHHFVVGAAAYGLANDVLADVPHNRDLIYNYGGLLLEWIILPFERTHGVFSLFIGEGIIDIDNENAAGDIVGICEPQWIFQTNINQYLQGDFEIGYRFHFSREKEYMRGYWDASQFYLGLGIRFGKFKIDYDP